ncbi:MAG: DASS family sodium-coupled anion symporter [Sandaracinaceae bacterium]
MRDEDPIESDGRWRIVLGAVGAPLVFVALLLLPLPLPLPAHRLAAIFGAVLIAWVTEVIPIAATALLIAPLMVVLGVTDASDAFRHYADPLLYLFVGGFFIAEAMSQHGLDRRIAKAVLTARWVAGAPKRVRVALMVAGALLSMWISNTASTAILIPILLKMLSGKDKKGATGAILALAYACSVGGLGTLVGSPPNVFTLRLLREGGVDLGFLDWSMIGLPTAMLVGLAVYGITRRMFPPETAVGPDTTTAALEAFDDVPVRWSRGEVTTAVSFGLAVLGWTVPGVVKALDLSFAATLSATLKPGVVALLAASILFAVPDGKGARVLGWRRAARIDWGIILLFGGGIALGKQLVETRLAHRMSEGFIAVTGIEDLWVLTGVCAVFTIFFTEVCSNTATANMLVPLVVATAAQLGVSPVPPALAVGLAASCAFMLPIATGPNAIAYSSGRVRQSDMMRVGLVLNVVSAAIVFLVVRVLCPLYGWTEIPDPPTVEITAELR